MAPCKHLNQYTGTCNLLYDKYCKTCGDIHCEKCSIETDHRLICIYTHCPVEVVEEVTR
jgi:hypothetical protein